MIKEKATVVAIEGDTAVLEAAVKSTCNACQAQSDCGTGVVARALAPRVQQLRVKTPLALHIGQQVDVGIPESGVVTASLWLYVVPLLALLLSALAFSAFLPTLGLTSELWVLAASIGTTFGTFVMVSGYLKKHQDHRYQPVIFLPQATSVDKSA